MHTLYLLFFLSFEVLAQAKPQIQVMPAPQTFEDYEHQFKGCPENSECDQVMGLQMSRWKELLTKLKNEKVPSAKKMQFLELFRSKYGIPVEFYTHQKSQKGFKPLLFNSPCKEHNPKEADKKIFRGTSFVQSLTEKEAVVWRDQARIEVPVGELFIPQTVSIYYPDGVKNYYLPLMEQPLFIKNKELHVLREDDDFFYMLKINPQGAWKVEDFNLSTLSEFEDKRQNVKCPVDKTKAPVGAFGIEYCKTIWDADLKQILTVKMHQGCVI